jgi:hypothetical protein
MSVVFQLFRASDLAQLTEPQLEELKKTVGLALNEPAVLAHLRERADEVFQQLAKKAPTQRTVSALPTTLSAGSSLQELREGLSAARLSQLYNIEDLRELDRNNTHRDILRMAIDCEVVHSQEVLLAIKTQIHQKFSSFFSSYKEVVSAKGHDRQYSPPPSGVEDNYVHIPPDNPPDPPYTSTSV